MPSSLHSHSTILNFINLASLFIRSSSKAWNLFIYKVEKNGNLNIQFDSFLSQLQTGLIPNIGVPMEEISLKLVNLGMEMLNIEI